MASAKLEILISAKETATRTMDGVKAAFARRTQEIEGMATGFMKNGEKIEKFLHGISLLKMATETEGFKKALNDISPTLQKATSDMLNYGVAIGGTLSLLKDLGHLLPLLGARGVGAIGGALAVGIGGNLIVDKLNEDSQKRIGQANKGGRSFGSLVGAGEEIRSAVELNALMARARTEHAAALKDGNATLANGINDFVRRLILSGDQIIAANKKAFIERGETNLATRQSAAMDEIKAIRRAAFEASPQGRLERIRTVSADLATNQRWLAATDPEKNAPYWLTLHNTVKALNEELSKLKKDAGEGALSEMFASGKDRLAALFRPSGRGTGAITTTRLGTLPGSPILADALSRQGLFAGGGRANPLTGLTERTLTSIDSGTKEQVRILRGIWQAVTTGNLNGLAP